MLNLPYPYRYKDSDIKIRVYLIPCPRCFKLRWIKIGGAKKICRSCSTTEKNLIRYAKRKTCEYKDCTKKAVTGDKYCRMHKRLFNNYFKFKARQIVRREILAGRLKRMPCEKCGETNTHAHHEDHRIPLIVNWYCPSHHLQAHGGRFK